MIDYEEFNDDLPRWPPQYLSLATLLNTVNALKGMSPFLLKSVINSIGLYGHLEILYTTKRPINPENQWINTRHMHKYSRCFFSNKPRQA